ncbi:hypothetical protein [Desertivirga brevis]|nr:hypothetical protein [Pedobacter sp. SYSU D00873]
MYIISSPVLMWLLFALLLSLAYMAYTVLVAEPVENDDENF